MSKVRNILVPIDFSELSSNAISIAADIAKQEGAKLYILHIVEVMHLYVAEYYIDSRLTEEIDNITVASAKDMFKKELEKFPELKDLDIQTEVRAGIPYQEILKEEKDKNIDLIVMGGYKKKEFIQYFIGSVADRVARGAKCTVLIIKR